MIPDTPSNRVVYFSLSSRLLADKSRNLFQADMKITVFKAKEIKKLQLFSLKIKKLDHFVSLISFYNSYFCLSLR